MTIQDQDGRAQTIHIFDNECDGMPELGLRIAPGAFGGIKSRVFCLMSPTLRVWLRPSACSSSAQDQTPRSPASQTALPSKQVTAETPCGLPLRLPPFDHALKRFEGVETVDLKVASRGDQHVLEGSIERDLESGKTPGDGQARSGHERNLQRRRLCDHLARLGPAVGKVLVYEHRHRRARSADDLEHFPKESPARVELL